ncbi:hypothetical protein PG985_000008 [Apiospora marii]|uniref:Tautomerase cis-CaaD-like domain-containing protein n=1 Tax=Apiospora marii TaxID=335849 RepID=A0ABR1QZJ7_9PEZI
MPGNCTEVLHMDHPDGPTEFLSCSITHREKGTKGSNSGHYSTILFKNAGCDAPDIETTQMTREFRALVHQAWRDACRRLFPADYCFAAGYFQPQPRPAVSLLPEDDAAFSLAILLQLRDPHEPEAACLRSFLRAFGDALGQKFAENFPWGVVFPEELWVVVMNPPSQDRAQSREARPPKAAAFEKSVFRFG